MLQFYPLKVYNSVVLLTLQRFKIALSLITFFNVLLSHKKLLKHHKLNKNYN